ncbi:MAG TPA: proline dehydrogenase family protein, partial [Aquabacterium sp.]|nr:proline dehydrogenase family protein [Aquabacterium sp.]
MKPERKDRLPCPWRDEAAAVRALQAALHGHVDWTAVKQRCTPWVEGVRRHPGPLWAMESLLHEFPLSSHEGLALMRLAEALLRVPDADTALALTIDQLRHQDQAPPPPPTQGLVQRLSHRVLDLAQRLLPDSDRGPHGWLQRLGGQTVVAATIRSVQLLGRQFVLGQTVDEALSHAQPLRDAARARGQRLCFSVDMLGEGARTWADAERYLKSYQHALSEMARRGDHDGLSIKLSALHPRFESAHTEAVLRHLIPRLHALALQAARADVLLTVDAEESWRL